MDLVKSLFKLWKRCKSFKKGCSLMLMIKRKFLPLNLEENKVARAPAGYVPIYIGREKNRFVIKTKHLNHHLFKSLLEEAESEYGYRHESLLTFPCKVDRFVDVLKEIDYYGDL
ncbi:auxin-induced protein 15A-like [Salvia hispanica]|uniref:auxin-induced protein 15A-like n=1 Tax=Salvia hispanica TaxID=49212 RepID=UPI0020098E36|nr:auxin-induced protein 15A-like [Salvia hispanica]